MCGLAMRDYSLITRIDCIIVIGSVVPHFWLQCNALQLEYELDLSFLHCNVSIMRMGNISTNAHRRF